ncbi:MAG TPA: hypothetical protein PLX23_04255 [Candidatus Hydrogenedens sp.]|nr:hypothetical protein [Candidatus Hydrogenedens sp.]
MKRQRVNIHIFCRFVIMVLAYFLPSIITGQEQFHANFIINRGTILINSENKALNSFFLVDTGVSIPVFDKNFTNITDKGKQYSGNNIVLDNQNLNILTIPNYQGKVLLSDLSKLSRKMGILINGIVPLYYPGYEIYLDFGNKKIVWQLISPQRTIKTKDMLCERLYFSAEQSCPKVSITLNTKIAAVANIDFAKSDYLVVPMGFSNEQSLITGKNRIAHFYKGKVVQYFRLASLKIGNLKFDNLLSVSVPGEKDISLGTRFWRQFVIYFNYEGAEVCLLKGNIIPEEKWIGTGILLDYCNDNGWAIGVVEDSPAWKEGNLKGGETLLKINEWEIKELNAEQILNLLNPPLGAQIKCTFLDLSKQTRTITLNSEEIL